LPEWQGRKESIVCGLEHAWEERELAKAEIKKHFKVGEYRCNNLGLKKVGNDESISLLESESAFRRRVTIYRRKRAGRQ
jgi:hypothetical protein